MRNLIDARIIGMLVYSVIIVTGIIYLGPVVLAVV